MLKKLLELRSVSGVGKYLIRQGVQSPNGKYYALIGIKQILQNAVYCIADQDSLNYLKKNMHLANP